MTGKGGKMKKFATGALVLILALSFGLCFAASPEKKAERAAKNWLELVDAGQYADSYDTAAEYFKNNVNKAEWERALTGVRKPLGEVISREVVSETRMNKMAGAPDGEYVVIKYRTMFRHKESSVELVTPMLDKDGKWRVSGYYIQ